MITIAITFFLGMPLVDSEPENLDVDSQAETGQEPAVNYYDQQTSQPPLR